jgi:hypothetical protein
MLEGLQASRSGGLKSPSYLVGDFKSPLLDALSTRASFLPRRPLFAARLLRPTWPAKHALRQITHRRFPELSRRTARTVFPPVTVIAEQAGHRVASTEKMHLEAVGLFLGACFRIDAPDVLLRIGISSLFHLPHSK